MIKNFAIIFVLLFIVKIIGFFAGSETAYLSVTKIKLRQMIKAKRRNARVAGELRENIDELLTIILIGINFMNTLGSSMATALAIELVGNSGVGIATLCFTFLSVIFGEIVPKTFAGSFTEKVVCKNAVILLILERLFFPVVFIFSAISKGTARLAEKFLKNNDSIITEEELKTLIEVGESEGTLESSEKLMLNRIIKFNDLTVHDIMKHRSMVKSVRIEADKTEVTNIFVSSGLSMLPVYEGSKESIAGVIHYKSVLLGNNTNCDSGEYVKSILKPVLFVPETFTALELLAKFKKERTEFAVALNEQGEMAGVATVDDILRVVFGRMTDDDVSQIPAEQRIKFISGREFIVPGDMKLDDVNAILKLNLESEEFMTIGGWLLERFGSLPSTGEIFYWQNVLFIIEDQARRRIRKIRIKFRNRGL